MTKEEFQEQVKALPLEKRKAISDHLFKAFLELNSAACLLHDTPLSDRDMLLMVDYSLTNTVSRLQFLFYDEDNE